MKSVLLIGLGRFGRHIAMKLNEMRHQVMAVDKNEKRVNAVLPFVMNAQIGDATNKEFIESLGVNNFDVCIVAIGDDFQSSLETTSLLKELGAKMVVSRAARDVHAKFLLRNGADEIVFDGTVALICRRCRRFEIMGRQTDKYVSGAEQSGSSSFAVYGANDRG